MKSISARADMLRAQGVIGPKDVETITEQAVETIIDLIEVMPSFNQKSAYDMGARDMKNAIVREIRGLL